jgi:hypothetical protein
MLVHLLIAVLVGALAYWATSRISKRHGLAVIIGIIVGVLVYVGALRF